MPLFIKLILFFDTNSDFRINVDQIVSITRDDQITRIDCNYSVYEVLETPAEIIEKIQQAERGTR